MLKSRARWVLHRPEARLARALASQAGIHPATAQVLVNRGIRDAQTLENFLKPSLSQLEEPNRMTDMEIAASRLRKAIAEREHVLIFGDYDADGLTASALLYRFLRMCGANCSVYIPSRFKEGYGLSDYAAEEIVRRRPNLVVTVDCGTRSLTQVGRLRAAGIDVIVTDHHESGSALPPANAVLNPKRPDCAYPFKGLAGVGVAFKLAWAVAKHFSLAKKVSPEHRRFLLDSVGLVAIGTVSDVAPLVGENRVLVAHGLKVLASSPHPGTRSLTEIARLRQDRISAWDLALRLGPRLNAAGRTGSPDDAIALLLEEDPSRAAELARRLDAANHQRQRMESQVLREVEEALEFLKPAAAIVLGSDSWSVGVLGIVCSRIVERTGKTAALVAFDGDEGKGSVRSPKWVDALQALEATKDYLLEYGAHACAGGFRIRRADFNAWKAAFEAAVRAQPNGLQDMPVLECDAELEPESLTLEFAEEILGLEPFGPGNPHPVFMLRGVEIGTDLRPLGRDGKHCSFMVSAGTRKLRAVAFDVGERWGELERARARRADLAFEISKSDWSGPEGFELVVRDISQ